MAPATTIYADQTELNEDVEAAFAELLGKPASLAIFAETEIDAALERGFAHEPTWD